MIPGSNILKTALRLVSTQTVTYTPTTGRAANAVGQYVATYGAALQVKGSLQPVARSLYYQYGLDFSKQYVMFYASLDATGVERGSAGDKIQYGTEIYQIESVNDWYGVDGWLSALCVRINP